MKFIDIISMAFVWDMANGLRNLNFVDTRRLDRDKLWRDNIWFTVHMLQNTVARSTEKCKV